ncbi:hypothetical protein DTL42_09730 [Bremerella cremea]|uniref:Zinc-finger domain-containing protein n=1 Tax=Bremerella cremea TaxID=1031537 RepID=A0A368KSG9_9BACT|nr:hypothetical protein DTL42_09730 [Bremerella cremea]
MSTSVCLGVEEIHVLLAGQMEPSLLSEAEQHLSACDHCRAKLENQIGDSLWWGEAERSLRSAENNQAEVSGNEPPNVAWLELLGPTDDPDFLGRIGPYEIVGLLGQGGHGNGFQEFRS